MAVGPSKFDRLPKTLSGVRDFNAAKAILLFLIGALLYVAHAAFIPVALALLFGLILSSPVESLHKLGISRGLGSVLILLVALSAFAGLIALVWGPAQEWYAAAPHALAVIQRKITPLARLMGHLEELTSRAGAVGSSEHSTASLLPLVPSPPTSSAVLLAKIRNYTVSLATFAIMTLFLMAGGPPMIARMTAAFFDHLKANHVLRMIERVRSEVGQFYVTTALINLGLGVVTTLAMIGWGMPTPYLWGSLAAVLSFIPYVGAITTLLLLTLVAIVSYDGLGYALGVSLTFAGLTFVEGQIIQPLLVGRRLEVNPLLIFLALWFGGFFWGIAGVILATPALVALKIIAEHSPNGEAMLNFLGPNQRSPGGYEKVSPLTPRS